MTLYATMITQARKEIKKISPLFGTLTHDFNKNELSFHYRGKRRQAEGQWLRGCENNCSQHHPSTINRIPTFQGLSHCQQRDLSSTVQESAAVVVLPPDSKVEVANDNNKPTFSSQALLRKQHNDVLSEGERALKSAFERVEKIRDDANASTTALRPELDGLRKCLEDLEYWEDALVVEKELEQYAESALDLAACIFRQGQNYMRLGDTVQGNSRYQKALEMYQVERGVNTYHADMGKILIALAGVEFERENIESCLETLNAAEDHFRKHGQEKDSSSTTSSNKSTTATTKQDPHPDIVKCLDNQGMIYRLKQDFFEALAKYEEAMQIVGKSDKEKRQTFQMHVADMLGATGDIDGALHYYEKIRKEDKERQTNKEEETALDGVILHCMGMLHSQQQKLELAKEELTKAVEIKRRVLKTEETNPELASSLLALGSIHGVMGNKRDALECFQHALIIAKANAVSENDPEVLQILRNISVLKGEKVPKWED